MGGKASTGGQWWLGVLGVVALIGAGGPAIAVGPGAAAPEQPPARIGNIWNAIPHQPAQGDVSSAEQGVGIAPNPSQNQRIDRELDELNRELLQRERSDPAIAPALKP